MSRFCRDDRCYSPAELALLQQAYEGACWKLGIKPTPDDCEANKALREGIAAAVMNAASSGERDLRTLSTYAIALGPLVLR